MSVSIEKSLRSETWTPGATIVLMNGEEFHFERPVMRGFYPVFDGPNIVKKISIHFGREYEECLDSADQAARLNQDIWPYVAWLADRMLTHANYRPEVREHYGEILYASPDNVNTWYSIFDIARGIDPKGRSSNG